MFKVLAIIFLIGGLASAADPSEDKSNEIDPKPPVNLDPSLRKALLKAITDLEKDQVTTEEPLTDAVDFTTEANEILETGDEEKNNEVGITKSVVNYHSFIVNEPNLSQGEPKVVSSDIGDSKPLDDDNLEARSEDIETKETSNAVVSQSRNPQKEIFAEDYKTVTKKPVSSLQKSVNVQQKQSAPVINGPPKPTYNEDGENIEQLEDVQVFQAPLVAAFTVHQDINGLPKKVVSIYKEAVRAPIEPLPSTFRGQQQPSQQTQNFNTQAQDQKQIDSIQQQLNLQQQLEQKQRLLEQQLRELQQQQRQHEDLLRQQQILQQQNQQQSQNSFNEQQRLKQQQFIQQQSQIQQQNVVRPQEFSQQPSSTSITFQPSISLPVAQPLSGSVELQPPQKEPSDFLNAFRVQSSAQFLSPNNIPITPSIHQQPPFDRPLPNSFNNFNQQSTLVNQQLPIEKTFASRFNPTSQGFQFQQQLPNDKPFLNFNTIPLQGPSSTRVFRHDSSSGNFGFNPNNLFNPVGFVAQNNNFRPPQTRFRLDDHLKNLLIQSGLTGNGKAQEDLSIVSKVLSLNHGIAPGSKVISENLQFLFGNGKTVPVRPRIN